METEVRSLSGLGDEDFSYEGRMKRGVGKEMKRGI